MSVELTGGRGGVLVGTGGGVGVGVGTEVSTGVADDRTEADGGVNVGGRVSILRVEVSVGARASPERGPVLPAFSKITAAWAEAKERSVPTRKVVATKMNKRTMSTLGRRGWFIDGPSIS
jgi:hypothetical protein